MINRTCPNCGKAWYSANDAEDWVCDSCGGKIPAKTKVARLCTLKNKFLCIPEDCDRWEVCQGEKYMFEGDD